jgi:hypothetical protein
MSKLTAEDVAWLENRLSDATADNAVVPSPEFVSRAQEELMHLDLAHPRRVRSSVLVGIIFSFSALIAALLLLMRRRTAAR